MAEIKIKHRIFEVVSEEKDDTFLATYKGKTYDVIKFEPKTVEGDQIVFAAKRLDSSGVKTPKLFLVDKKGGYVVREHIEGKTVMDMIVEGDLPDEVYRQLFINEYMAKIHHMTLNYEIDKWVMVDDTLYYIYPMFILYDEEKDLVKKYLKLWFPTKELLQFLGQKGLTFGKNRLKDEYTTNKEMVLMAVKYYR